MDFFKFQEKSLYWDAKYVFPRPANEQYLSSYKTFLRLGSDLAAVAGYFFVAGLSLAILWIIYRLISQSFRLSFLDGVGALLFIAFLVFSLFVIGAVVKDIFDIFIPYRLEFQREAHGGRRWANVPELKRQDVNVLEKNFAENKRKGVRLAPFRHYFSHLDIPKYYIFLDEQRLSQAMIVYGPPGSGKSSTFFMPVIRQFADFGGAIVLDVKGELYAYTSHYYANVYRLDIQNPLFSDWLDLFSECRRNPDRARRIAAYMTGLDPNKSTTKEPFWDQTATSMLAVLILLLCEQTKYPTPQDILKFLAENPKSAKRTDPITQKKVVYSPLNEAFESCSYEMARNVWKNNFSQMPEETFGSVKSNADNAMQQLISPRVTEILRPPTEKEKAMGRRRIDWTNLRKLYAKGGGAKKGSAVYVVISPSDAVNMDVFLRVIFSVALDTLRETATEGTNVMVALDEAGNVPLAKMPEGINTDRSKGICYFLGYQDKNQPVSQYGRDAAGTFLGTAGVNIFLPGVDDETAKLASERIGQTTILQRSSSDAKDDGFDHEKMSEASRKLMLPQELTEMPRFMQCVVMIKGVSPIRTRIPPDAKKQDARQTRPVKVVDQSQLSEEVLRDLKLYQEKPETPALKKAGTEVNENEVVILDNTQENQQAFPQIAPLPQIQAANPDDDGDKAEGLAENLSEREFGDLEIGVLFKEENIDVARIINSEEEEEEEEKRVVKIMR